MSSSSRIAAEHRNIRLCSGLYRKTKVEHRPYPHTIDRWDDATGEIMVEQIAAVGDLSDRAGDVPRGGEALAKRQNQGAQPGHGSSSRAGPNRELSANRLSRRPCFHALFSQHRANVYRAASHEASNSCV